MKDLLTANNSGKFWRELGPAIKLCDLTIACRCLSWQLKDFVISLYNFKRNK